MTAATKEDQERAKQQARAKLDSIVELMAALDRAEENGEAEYDGQRLDADSLRERIWETPLSVQVRDGWRTPGSGPVLASPVEYKVLLCTGGPAVRIRGDFGQFEPETATLQYQDWLTPWMDYLDTTPAEDAALLAYCRCLVVA